MRVTLIHNPYAGSGGPSKDGLLWALAAAGHDVGYRPADAPGTMAAPHDPGFAAELVVVAGGDGTVGKIVKRLAGRRIPIAVLPAGTANNIATALGAGSDLRAQAARWASTPRRAFDVGLAAGPWGRARFL